MPNQGRYILVLAANGREATTYARRMNLRQGTYRCVASARSIRGLQVADAHVLPGFNDRVDRHAIKAQLRWARDIVYIDVEMPEPPVVDQGDGMGEQLDLLDLVATYDAPFDMRPERAREIIEGPTPAPLKHKSFDPEVEIVVAPQPAADSPAHVGPAVEDAAEQAEEPKTRTRRSRCKKCGRLTFAAYEDDATDHDAAQHNVVVADRTKLFEDA